jgi:hypothetical protein
VLERERVIAARFGNIGEPLQAETASIGQRSRSHHSRPVRK